VPIGRSEGRHQTGAKLSVLGSTVGGMATARFKDLCIDAADEAAAARFYADLLGLRADGDRLDGPTPTHTVWLNGVPESKQAKNRVHLDVLAGSLDEVTALGATVLEPDDGQRGWTVFTDPEGQEFCVFLRDQPPPQRLYEVVVDAADSARIAHWWAGVFGSEAKDGNGYHYLAVPDAPFEYLVFVPVPEAKTVKNRVHWDVTADPAKLVAAGAALLRPRDPDIGWHVLADPDGNEFCAFEPS